MKIETSIEIEANIETVWQEIINIKDWNWNQWTRLEASEPIPGQHGKLHASFDGDNQWKQYDFTFGNIDHTTHYFSWYGKIMGGMLFSGDHSIQLVEKGTGTLMIHNEVFGGLLPAMG
ncbi:hypothetical protein HDV02_005980 [Globomyces sp. JEL0801]|nr:hypothetical protein HDV02_005980 [Globomyces sp. JEL0801]